MINRKNCKKAVLLNIFLQFACLLLCAQISKTTRYFNADWLPTSKDSAFYFTEMVKADGGYNCTSYWAASGKLNCISSFADTNFSKPMGKLLRYFESGQTEDSTYFNEDGSVKNTYHFFPNGKTQVHYTYNPKSKKAVTEAYDLKGNRLENFVFHQPASFQEGQSDWMAFLNDNLNSELSVKNGAPVGTYEVIVSFMIGKNGKLTNISALTNHGFGMEAEAVRVIKKSPKWNSEIYLGKPIDVYRKQPIAFIIKKK